MTRDRDALDFAGFTDAGLSAKQERALPEPRAAVEPARAQSTPSPPVENQLDGPAGCLIVVLVSIVLLIIFAASDGGGSSSSTANTRPAGPQAPRTQTGESSSPSQAPTTLPASATQSINVETAPAIGTTETLGRPELRWCLHWELRLTKLHELVIDEPLFGSFNTALDDYRRRCRVANFRESDFNAVKRERDTNKLEVEESAVAIYRQWSRQHMHPIVISVQQNLNALGYDPGPVDGVVGPQTRAAIRRLESDLEVKPTGLITFELRDALQMLVEGN